MKLVHFAASDPHQILREADCREAVLRAFMLAAAGRICIITFGQAMHLSNSDQGLFVKRLLYGESPTEALKWVKKWSTTKPTDPEHPHQIWQCAPRGQKRAEYRRAIKAACPTIAEATLRKALRLCQPRQYRFIGRLLLCDTAEQALQNAKEMPVSVMRVKAGRRA